jgi:hypothetical protein
VLVTLLAFVGVTAVVAHLLTRPAPPMRFGTVTGSVLLVALFFGTALIHELGHYAASKPYFEPTIRPSLLNGVFPAIVTKTNDAWRCPRSVRIWINLAGPCVDAVVTLAIAVVHLAAFPFVGELTQFVLFAFMRLVFSLNPLIRGDGYWILVDVFGSVNLNTRGFSDLKSLTFSGPAIYAFTSLLFTAVGVVVMGSMVASAAGLL